MCDGRPGAADCGRRPAGRRTCGTSGGSRRAGGRGGRCAAATSTWCSTTAATRSSSCDRRRRPLVRAAGMTPATPSFTPTPATRSWTAPPSPTSWPLRAAELGYDAFALTDHDSLSGSLEFAHAARDAGLRPITGCELTLDDGAHLTLLAEDAGRLPQPLPAAHAGPRATTAGRRRRRSSRSPATPRGCTACRAAPATGTVARLVGDGPAGRGRGRGPGAAGDLRPRAVLDRAAAPLLARRRPPQPAARGAGRAAAGARRSPPATRTPTRPPRAYLQDALVAIRLEHHAGRLRAPSAAATTSRCCARPPRPRPGSPPRRCAAAASGGRPLPLRPDPGPRLPLPRLRLRDRRVGAGQALHRICRDELERRYAGLPHLHEARARLEQELGLIAHHGLAGFFLLHRDILEMAREVAVRGARRERRPPAAAARPRPRARASARSSAI